MKIGMTGITTNSRKEAFNFYTKVLGFKEHTYMPDYNLAIVTADEDPTGTTLLLGPDDNPIAKITRLAYINRAYQPSCFFHRTYRPSLSALKH